MSDTILDKGDTGDASQRGQNGSSSESSDVSIEKLNPEEAEVVGTKATEVAEGDDKVQQTELLANDTTF